MTGLLPNDRLLRALRRRSVDRTPVWFMRQAGRSLPEYRARRGDADILETCRRPDEVVELTLQPLRRMPLDAAILFSDIMVPLHAIGVPIRIEAGRGPVIEPPLRDASGLERLRPLEPETDAPYVAEAVRLLVKELEVPLIGFAGAPFTLASYLIEGGPSRTFARTKALLFSEPALFDRLLAMLAEHRRGASPRTGGRRCACGAALRLVGRRARSGLIIAAWWRRTRPGCSRRSLAWASRRSTSGSATSHLLDLMRDAGGDAIGVDHRLPLDDAWAVIGHDRAIQGNLDPTVLLGYWDAVERKAEDVLARAALRDGHVFNLGHGVLPDTPVEYLQRLVDLVHAETERPAP